MQPTGEIHPLAELFPMLPDDELADLAADIAANGLNEPIVIDAEGVLIDGRNRLAACRQAGVEPRFRTLGRQDAIAYILSSNVTRRHLSKGQQAMAIIEAEFIRNGSSSAIRGIVSLAEQHDASQDRLAVASIVHHYGHPELCQAVLAGGRLDEAYESARQIKQRIDDAKQWVEEAERRRFLAERELNKTLGVIKLAMEEIGPQIPIPPIPDMTVTVSRPMTDPAPGLNKAALDDEAYVLGHLGLVKRELAALCAREIVPATVWPESQLPAIRAAVSQIVTHAYALVEQYNAALANVNKLRSVR